MVKPTRQKDGWERDHQCSRIYNMHPNVFCSYIYPCQAKWTTYIQWLEQDCGYASRIKIAPHITVHLIHSSPPNQSHCSKLQCTNKHNRWNVQSNLIPNTCTGQPISVNATGMCAHQSKQLQSRLPTTNIYFSLQHTRHLLINNFQNIVVDGERAMRLLYILFIERDQSNASSEPIKCI